VLPVGRDDFGTTNVGVPIGVPILANDHGSLESGSVIITSQPAHGTVAWNEETEEAVYTPEPGWSGIDTFTYSVSDAYGQQLKQTVTIDVVPQAEGDSGVTREGTAVTLSELDNDLGKLDSATVMVTTPPGHGTAKVDPTSGQVTYTPAPGFTGQDTYIYSVRDFAGQVTSATDTIIVYASPSPPPAPPQPAPIPDPAPPAPFPPSPAPIPEPHSVGDAELVVTKRVTPKVAAVGGILTYTVTVTNRGPDTARQVVGTDASTGKATILSLKPSHGTCTIEPALECSFGDVASGVTVTVLARVRVLTPGMLRDTAAVSARGPDPDPSTAHASATVRILTAPLTITKRASATHVLTGSAVSFALRVTNRSGAAVHHVSVCDRLPTGLVYISGGTPQGAEVCWKVTSLAAGRSRSFLVRAQAVASHTTIVTNRATVGAHGIATRQAHATVVIINPTPTFTG
jgi:uncharacterized repeat protein (TIGR01451 family)